MIEHKLLEVHIEVKKDDIWYHYSHMIIRSEKEKDHLLYACINGTDLDILKDWSAKYNKICPVAKTDIIPQDISPITDIHLRQDSSTYETSGTCVLDRQDLIELQHQLSQFEDLQFDNLRLADIFRTNIFDTFNKHQEFDDVRMICWFTKEI